MIQQWLDTFYPGSFYTNREIINDPTIKPAGWLNPFTEPDKFVEELQHFKTGKDIREHIELYYPGIDPKKYVQKKLDENKERDIKYCSTTWIWKLNPMSGEYDKIPRRCKHWNDCPLCKKWKIKQHTERLDGLRKKRVVIAKTEAEEKEIKAGRSQNEYLRILRDDGTTAFILNEEPQDDSEKLDSHLIKQLAVDMLPNEDRGRFSGKLGISPVVIEKPEDAEQIEIKGWMIRFTDESLLPGNDELQKVVLEKAKQKIVSLSKDIETIKLFASEIDKVLDEACTEYKIEKQFLYKETIYIRLSDIYWKWLSDPPK